MSEHAHHRNYVKIWGILLALLVVSVVGPMFGIRVVTLITAFGIAVVKAYIVAKNFMHLDVEKPIVHWALGISVIFMVLLFAGVAPDVMKDDGQRWRKDARFHIEATEGHGAGGGHGQATAGHGGAADAPGTVTGATEGGHGDH